MSLWWSLRLRSEAASVPFARRLLLSTMERAGVDPEISYELSVALTEACANAVEHGTAGRGADRGGAGRQDAYRVTAYLDGELCRIEVADSGPGFPPARIDGSTGAGSGPTPPGAGSGPTPPGAENGRGLDLIGELADDVRLSNRNGAVLSFDKTLKFSGAPAAAAVPARTPSPAGV
ncbi:ATP-binding protein [Streptomyces sp. KLOTTS4A1]|uniref:ATP-binding protein n=1 Tax=Streptomyces sp. KLOTTS4A1 TaxID=3390996 RepID=UPI0039F53AE6